MLVPFLPNTYMSGGQTRWYNIIKYLSKDHDITLFSLIKDDSEKKFIPELEKYCTKVRVFKRPKSPWTARNLLMTAFSFYPLLVIRNWSFKERQAIKEELASEKFDLVHAETFYVMPHLPKTAIPSILVEQTIEYQVYKHHVDTKIPFFLKPIYMIDVLKLKYWEQYYWKRTNRLVAVSDVDKEVMQKLVPGIKVDVVPNGIDYDHFKKYKIVKRSAPTVLYGAANFKWLQNVEAADILLSDIWPKIKSRVKDAKLWIVGRHIPQSIREIEKKDSAIEITEGIPDVREALSAATLMIVPVKGPGGTRLKVLEALAAGLPVVSTSVGAAGLDLKNGYHAMIEDDPTKLAESCVKVINDKKLAQKIGAEGQKFAKKHFDWKIIVKIQNQIYQDVLAQK